MLSPRYKITDDGAVFASSGSDDLVEAGFVLCFGVIFWLAVAIGFRRGHPLALVVSGLVGTWLLLAAGRTIRQWRRRDRLSIGPAGIGLSFWGEHDLSLSWDAVSSIEIRRPATSATRRPPALIVFTPVLPHDPEVARWPSTEHGHVIVDLHRVRAPENLVSDALTRHGGPRYQQS